MQQHIAQSKVSSDFCGLKTINHAFESFGQKALNQPLDEKIILHCINSIR